VELTLATMKTLSDLMDRALALEGTERTQWLDELAQGPHAELSSILKEMLSKRSEISTRFLSHPLHIDGLTDTQAVARALPKIEAGSRIGAYTLMREIGRGGMGVVWLAERSDGQMKRQIALKLPMLSATDALAERFVRERNILAQLEHPNIARLYDAGVTEAGQPFLALEYVSGEPITNHCDRKRLSVRERLHRFLDVARAVQFAHANLVVHRDLKPNNILVTEEGAVRLLDFGIAKLLDNSQSHAQETELTLLSGRALTLDYASPEQVQGKPIGTATDVYSLGVILYQLLCGEKPYSFGREGRFNAEKVLSEIAIVALSKRAIEDGAGITKDVQNLNVTSARERADARQSTPERLSRMLAGDLETIVAKAMRKAPNERYGTVAEFAADIERYLQGLPVLAQPESWRYRAGKFILRNRVTVGAATAVACSVIAGLGVALWQANVAREAAVRADNEAAAAREQKSRADNEAQIARRERERADAEAKVAQLAASEAKTQAARADEQSTVALAAATRADASARQASNEADRADQEARVARQEAARSSAVQTYLVDLFSSNSNDQKNAIQVRSLNAKQLLDRGVQKLEQSRGADAVVDATLYRLFGNLYENLTDYETAKRLHVQSVAAAEKTWGKTSKQYAMAILDLAWIEGYERFGKRIDLIDEAKVILRRITPGGAELAQALYYEAENVDQSDPPRALKAVSESLAILEKLPGHTKLRATAFRSLGHAQRAAGNHDVALDAYRKSVEQFTLLSGPDNPEVAESLGGVAACLRQLLRLTEAESVAKTSVETLRPFERDRTDAHVFSRILAQVMTDRGKGAEAQALLEKAHAKLPADAEGRPHAWLSSVSVALARVARARGDDASAFKFAQRSRAELRSRNPHVTVTVLTLIADTALQLGDVDAASNAVEEAKKIQSERGLPALSASLLRQSSAKLAVAKGEFAEARALLQDPESQTADAQTPLDRLQTDLTKAHLLHATGQSQAATKALQPWIENGSTFELPLHLRAELYLLAGQAQIQTAPRHAMLHLAEAEKSASVSQLPTSAMLIAIRDAKRRLAQ
jgi:serine/threonine protein kinase